MILTIFDGGVSFGWSNIAQNVVTTFAVNSFIWVEILRIDSVLIVDIGKRRVHITTITTVVVVFEGAVDQILFTYGHQLSGFQEILALKGSSLKILS